MPNEKARGLVRDAMESRDVYEEMSRKESAVWSNHFVSPEHKSVREREQKAGEVLRPARNQLRLAKILKEFGLNPEKGLSLGCGSGRAERMLLKANVCQSFHGIDIAEGAIGEAQSLSSEERLRCTYETQDLNFVTLPEKSYDLVIAQTSLHHVLHLEHLFDEVIFTLRPGGVFWVHDYVGESQFQFEDERLKLMNDILAILPERLRVNHFNGRPVNKVVRREPGQLVSPFEAIRSGETKKLLLERFDIIIAHEETAYLDRVAGLGMLQNFVQNDDTKVIYELLHYFDQLLVKNGAVAGVQGQYLLRPKI